MSSATQPSEQVSGSSNPNKSFEQLLTEPSTSIPMKNNDLKKTRKNLDKIFQKLRNPKAINSRKKKIKRKFFKNQLSNFNLYIHKVHKVIDPGLTLSKKSMVIMNHFMNDMFERISTEACKLRKLNKRKTLSHRDIMNAVKLTLPGELAVMATGEANKFLFYYLNNKED